MLNKNIIVLSSLFISAASCFGVVQSDLSSDVDVNLTNSGSGAPSIGASFVYGVAMNNLFSGQYDEGEEIDVTGVNFIFSKELPIKNKGIKTDFFIQSGLVGGDNEKNIYTRMLAASMIVTREETTLLRGDLSFGVGVSVEASEYVSFSLRPRLGVSVMNLGYKHSSNVGVSAHNKMEDTAKGMLYGIGATANINFNENHGMMIGIEYLGTTVRPEIKFSEGDFLKVQNQSYVNFSVGYRYSF